MKTRTNAPAGKCAAGALLFLAGAALAADPPAAQPAAKPPVRTSARILSSPTMSAPQANPTMDAYRAPPKDEYERAIHRQLNELLSVDAMHLVCKEKFKQSAHAIEEAYADWQGEYRSAVHDISVHARAMILRNSKGDRDTARLVEGWFRGDALSSARGYMLRSETQARIFCNQFEEHLATPQFNVEKNGGPDLALIRAHPLPDSR
jgi:hypothetical protein